MPRLGGERAGLVAPFRGERYRNRSRLSGLIAPPYDVIAPSERPMYADRDRHNIVHLTLPATDGDPYTRAAGLLADWRSAGVFVRDRVPSLYVLRQEFTTPEGHRHVRTGVIGGVAAEPFVNGRVKPHEKTHPAPKDDRLALLRAAQATFEALLVCARDEDGTLRGMLEKATQNRPLARAELTGVKIALWRVAGQQARALAAAASQGALYIADGHHRYETAVAYREENPAADRVPALIVSLSDPGLLVLPTHRLVYGGPVDGMAVVNELRERFQIRELLSQANYADELATLRNRGTACVVVLPGGKAQAFLLKGGASLGDLPFANQPAVASLDVARIDELIVKRLLASAGDVGRIDYSADPHHVIDEVQRGDAAAGVLLNPTAVEQVLAVADAGATMPQKSTYFMPKVPSGLVIMGYEDRQP